MIKPITTEQKRAVIYCRVSTTEQVEEGNSLVSQEKVCKEYALKNGYEVVEIFIEKGESAKTQERTEFQRLLKYCAERKNNIQAVIAYKIDRISRNTDDYSQIRILLKRYGVEIKSTSEYFEDTPAGRFMENIIANVAQFDNDVRTERSVNGMRDAMREGRYVWKAPLGYDNARINGKSTIRQNSNSGYVREAFEMVARNEFPIVETLRRLTRKGLSINGKTMSKGHFFRLLKNEVYAGWIIKFGERHKGLFEPIVSQETFDQVNRVLKYRSHATMHYLMENPDFPLRRFTKHPDGSNLTGGWSKGRTKKYAYYRFSKIKMDFPKHILEEKFKSFFDNFKLKEEHYQKFKRFIKENFIKNTADNKKEEESLLRQISELKETQRTLIQKSLKGIINDSLLQQHLEYIEKEIMELHSRASQIPKKGSIAEALNYALEFIKNPSKTWSNLSFAQKLQLQWFNFPEGVSFDGVNFRTTKISNVLKGNSIFLTPKSLNVPLSFKRLNHQDTRENIPQMVSDKKPGIRKGKIRSYLPRSKELLTEFNPDLYQKEVEELSSIING